MRRVKLNPANPLQRRLRAVEAENERLRLALSEAVEVYCYPLPDGHKGAHAVPDATLARWRALADPAGSTDG